LNIIQSWSQVEKKKKELEQNSYNDPKITPENTARFSAGFGGSDHNLNSRPKTAMQKKMNKSSRPTIDFTVNLN